MFIAGLALTLTAVAATARLVRSWRRSRSRRGVDRARAEAAEQTNERQARARTDAAWLDAHQPRRQVATVPALVEMPGCPTGAPHLFAEPASGGLIRCSMCGETFGPADVERAVAT